jgi:hypothetical protein
MQKELEPIKINATVSKPYVSLDPKTGIMEISGISRPEDIFKFFNPITNWLYEYANKPNSKTVLMLKLMYFNSGTAHVILKIINLMNTLYNNGYKIEIHWYYAEDDEESLEAGEDYASLVDVPFTFIKY